MDEKYLRYYFLGGGQRSPGLYVELRDGHLLINVVYQTRIPYNNIAGAEHATKKHGMLMRAAINGAVAMNRLGGRNYPWARAEGEPTVEVTLRRRMRAPPFFIPRRSWQLAVEDAESLLAELRRRIASG